MTTALELDPFLLPLPTPNSPVVLEHLATPIHAHLNARYADPSWPLAPLIANPSSTKRSIYWRNCPAVFQDELRLATWNLINGQLRPTFLRERATALRGRVGMDTIRDTVRQWMLLATWLEARQIHNFAGCDTGVFHDYGQHLLDTHSDRRTVHGILIALTRLWAYDQLSARSTGNGELTTTCPRRRPSAGRTPPSRWQSKHWGRCSSGRCASSTSFPTTSSPPGPNANVW